MALTSGYLVIYSKNLERFAKLYDDYLNFVKDIKPDSEEVVFCLDEMDAFTGLEDETWEEALAELSSMERAEAVAYHIYSEMLTNSEMRIEEIMEENRDEINYGYHGYLPEFIYIQLEEC
jgi:hypothetical protein